MNPPPPPARKYEEDLYKNMGRPLGDAFKPKPRLPTKPLPREDLPAPSRPPPVTPREQSSSFNSISSTETDPPSYSAILPKPFMNGYMEKASVDSAVKNPAWTKKFIEVSEGNLIFYDSVDKRNPEQGVTCPLESTALSWYDKRTLELKGSTVGSRLFRCHSELRANKWFHVLAFYCSVPASAEGYCKKLSGRKNVLEDRYLKLSTNGILSWFKGEDDSEPRGSLMVQGERLSLDQDDPKTVFIHISERRFHFQFLDERNAKMWVSALEWHVDRTPQMNPKVHVRNPIKLKQNDE